MQDQQPTVDDSLKPESCWDQKTLPTFKAKEDVFIPKSCWQQDWLSGQGGKDDPYGPDLCRNHQENSWSCSFCRSTPLSRSWVNYMKWTLLLPLTTISDSLLLSQDYIINESSGGTWLIVGWLWEPTWEISLDICGFFVGGISLTVFWTWESDRES